MKVVKKFPEPTPRVGVKDPWLDGLLDGKIRHIEPADWEARYKTVRGAANAIRQAATSRGVRVTVQTRENELWVQANLNGDTGGE